jgi:hypothetical protein
VLPLTRSVEYAFTFDASLTRPPFYFCTDDEIFVMIMKKKIFSFEIFFFFGE